MPALTEKEKLPAAKAPDTAKPPPAALTVQDTLEPPLPSTTCEPTLVELVNDPSGMLHVFLALTVQAVVLL